MTRGYVVVSRKNKIAGIAWQNSDAYLAGDFARGIEDMFSKEDAEKHFLDYINFSREKMPQDNQMVDWVKSVSDLKKATMVDYIYHLNNGKLEVWHFGKKVLTCRKEDLPYRHILNYESGDCAGNMRCRLSYDDSKCAYSKDEWKIYRSFIKERKPLDEVRGIINTPIKNFVLVESSHLNTGVLNQFGARVRIGVDDDHAHTFEFYFYTEFDGSGKVNLIALQFPRCRMTYLSFERPVSEKAALKKLLYLICGGRVASFDEAYAVIKADAAIVGREYMNREQGKPITEGCFDMAEKLIGDKSFINYDKDFVVRQLYLDAEREKHNKAK